MHKKYQSSQFLVSREIYVSWPWTFLYLLGSLELIRLLPHGLFSDSMVVVFASILMGIFRPEDFSRGAWCQCRR